MAFPATVDSFTTSSGSDTLATTPHSTLHNNAHTALTNVETYLRTVGFLLTASRYV